MLNELYDRLLVRQGHVFGHELQELQGGSPSPPGEIERYVDAHPEGPGIWKWRHYFVDIEPACKAYETDGISVVIGDQGDPAFWRRFLDQAGPIDAVIDDGSHRPADQIVTLKALLPWLKPGGVFICEDVHGTDNAFSRFIDGFTRNLDGFAGSRQPDGAVVSDTSPFQRAIASVHRYPFVTVIQRTLAPVTRLEAPRQGTEWQPSYEVGERSNRRSAGV
jgi:hypothetical protein